MKDKKITIELFNSFVTLLNKNNIKFWLMAGTLLGAIRTNTMISWDEGDIDIGIDAEDYWKVRNLLNNQDFFSYSVIWRREISIVRSGISRNIFHIDMFFIENNEEASCLYSYKPNSFSGIWDIEQKLMFPKDIFKELKEWMFEGIAVKVPAEYEKILSLHYGHWKTPKKNWTANNIKWDIEYREIAIIIPTFLRFIKFKKLVESILKTYPDSWYKLYIADQGIYSYETEEYYKTLREKGHKVIYLPFNCGVSFARNYLVHQTVEPFILILDDDFEITKETKLQNFISVLLKNKDIGVVGGTLELTQDYNYDLLLKNNILYYIRPNLKNIQEAIKSHVQTPPISFYYQDIVLQFAMFKREVFNDILWDADLKSAEHTDFFLQLKQLNKWTVTFTNSAGARHQSHKDNSKEYVLFRKNINSKIGQEKFKLKWIATPENTIYLKEN